VLRRVGGGVSRVARGKTFEKKGGEHRPESGDQGETLASERKASCIVHVSVMSA